MVETTATTGPSKTGPLKSKTDWRETLHHDGLQLGTALSNLQRDIEAGKAARTATDAGIQAGLPAIQDTVDSIADTIETNLGTDGDYVPNGFSSGELRWETSQLVAAHGPTGEEMGHFLREEQEYQIDAAAAQAAEANGADYDPEAGANSTPTTPEAAAGTPEPGVQTAAEPQAGDGAQTSQPQPEQEGGGGFGAAMEKAAALLGIGLAARTTARAFAPQRFTAAKPSIPTVPASVPTAKFKAATTAKRVVNAAPPAKKTVVPTGGNRSPTLLTQKSYASPRQQKPATVAATPATTVATTTTPRKGPPRKGPGSSGPGSPAV